MARTQPLFPRLPSQGTRPTGVPRTTGIHVSTQFAPPLPSSTPRTTLVPDADVLDSLPHPPLNLEQNISFLRCTAGSLSQVLIEVETQLHDLTISTIERPISANSTAQKLGLPSWKDNSTPPRPELVSTLPTSNGFGANANVFASNWTPLPPNFKASTFF